jgi:hypothetical protein
MGKAGFGGSKQHTAQSTELVAKARTRILSCRGKTRIIYRRGAAEYHDEDVDFPEGD